MPGLQRALSRVEEAEVVRSCGKDRRICCLGLEPARLLGEPQCLGRSGQASQRRLTGGFPEHTESRAGGSLSLWEVSKKAIQPHHQEWVLHLSPFQSHPPASSCQGETGKGGFSLL